ncbi:MAG: MBL fold metallo-hydrolase [Aristaeellaceae bacterium]
MKLTVLGLSGLYPTPDGATSGYLVQAGEDCIQLDLGSGVLAALTRYTAPETLTALVLSHWHYDHACDVLPLIYRLEATGATLDVFAPVDENSPIRQAVLRCKNIRLHDIAGGDEIALGGAIMRVYTARHPVPAVMLRLTRDGSTLCYTGDTNTVPELNDFAREADLLLADGLFPAAMWAEGKPHLSAEHVARLAVEAGAKQVVITHLNPAIDPAGLLREARAIRPDVTLAERFKVYQL